MNIELLENFVISVKSVTSLTLDFSLIEDDTAYTSAVLDLFFTHCTKVRRFKIQESGSIPQEQVTAAIENGLEGLESLHLVSHKFGRDHLFSNLNFPNLTTFSFSEENDERISSITKRALMRFSTACPNLISLSIHFELVFLDPEIIESFVSNCASLESLELSEIRISLPLLTRICRYILSILNLRLDSPD
jgi:hypothetical protein